MESKINRISIFIETLEERNQLSDDQQLMMMGGSDPNDQEQDGANNCNGGNCYKGCGGRNIICINFVQGCGDR